MTTEDFSRPRVNIVQACVVASVSRSTIYAWMRLGRIEFVRTPTGQVRIYLDTLLRPQELTAA